MAYLKPQTPLKDLNSGDYFYPLTTIDQIITGTSRLSTFLSEDNNLLNLNNIGNITGNIILNGTLTVSGNTIFDNSVDIKYNNFITFYGKNNNTSPMARMGYMSAISGGTVHCVNASNGYQASGAFYIWSNGCDKENDNGGIAIDNEGVTVFGAGDIGDNFTGVFRVINEDDIASGPKFLVQKNGHTFIPAHLAVGGYNNTSYGLSANSFICNGSSCFYGDTTHNGTLYFNRMGENYFTNGPNDAANGYNGALNNLVISAWYGVSFTTSAGGQACTGTNAFSINTRNGSAYCGRMYGAVWNDYAEFRKGQMDNLKPGQVVTEVGNGEMKLANQKLQKGCKILSDTFGFALGETKECKLPIAVSGRVLVYCDTPKEELEPGDCLCANYNGNAIKMTSEEIIKYPDRIIGTISEIPDYEIWHGGRYRPENKNNPEDIVVNGRIWVYVR